MPTDDFLPGAFLEPTRRFDIPIARPWHSRQVFLITLQGGFDFLKSSVAFASQASTVLGCAKVGFLGQQAVSIKRGSFEESYRAPLRGFGG